MELAVGSADELGAAFVDLRVVAVAAQQAEVVDVGGPAVLPVDDVVRLAEAVGGPAAGAAPVARREGDALGDAGVAILVAQPQGLALRVEQGGQDVGVEREAEEFARCEGGAVDEAGVAQLPGGGVVVGDHQQGGALRLARAFAGDQHLERVGEPLRGRGTALGVLGVPELLGRGGERGFDARAGDGIEPPEQLVHAVGLLLEAHLALGPLAPAALLEVLTG